MAHGTWPFLPVPCSGRQTCSAGKRRHGCPASRAYHQWGSPALRPILIRIRQVAAAHASGAQFYSPTGIVRGGHTVSILAVCQAPNFSPTEAPLTLQPRRVTKLNSAGRHRHNCHAPRAHRLWQVTKLNTSALLNLRDLELSLLNLRDLNLLPNCQTGSQTAFRHRC